MTDLLESRWTSPREECPHPEWWHSDDDESTELEVTLLVSAFVRALQPECVVETGSAFGQTAYAIGAVLRANSHGHLHSLEANPDRAAAARARVDGLPVEIIEADTLLWEPPHAVDFVWFDSALNIRVAEFRRYRPSLSPRCVVGFHDAGPQHGIRQDIEALAGEWIYLPTPRGVIFGTPA
jgi:predicted O-methyltransferase YrrM